MALISSLVFSALAAASLLGTALLLFPRRAKAVETMSTPTGVLICDKEKALDGYTLISPMQSTSSYLLDMEGNIVHEWKTAGLPGLYAELLPNGNLLRGIRYEKKVPFGGVSGGLQEIDWDGNVVWEHNIYDDGRLSHHAFDRMPNGNTLIVAWEHKTCEEAEAKGRKPGTLPRPGEDTGHSPAYDGLWADYIVEVDKEGREVWSWHAWDHIDTGKDEFDINYRLPIKNYYGDSDWMHLNSVRYNPETDQILISSRNFCEAFIVSHDAEGRVLWRFGTPASHGEGERPSFYDDGSQVLFGNHDATWLGNDRISLFDNGWQRPQANRSRAVVMDMASGRITWEYAANNLNAFYSAYQGSAQRLPNGNTLITNGAVGQFQEVTPDHEIVWEYISPWYNPNGKFNLVYRAYRVPYDYVPQLKKPQEFAVTPPENITFTIPASKTPYKAES